MLSCSSAGKSIRMRRLFNAKTEKSLTVAMDHGKTRGALPGLENFEQVLERILEEKPDAVLLNPGALRLAHRHWKGKDDPGIIVAADIPIRTSIPRSDDMGLEYRLLCSVEEIVSLGADAIKALLIFCREDLRNYGDNLRDLAQVIKASDRFGLPVMVEATLWGAARSDTRPQDASLVADICRVATEMGADLLKVPFIGTAEGFRKVTEITPIPVTILGGAKTENVRDVLATVERAMEANVSGLVFGRNIWQHPKPDLVLRAMKRMIHEKASKEEVLKEFPTN